jgi:16S rRNA (adenine1518-N6/adenine1519-N6)-dimethyltransferase
MGRNPRAKKSLGQHFLVDRRVLVRIVRAAEISENDTILEIGPGRGILTRRLAESAEHVVAVEIDQVLADALATEFKGRPGVKVICADARESDIEQLVPGNGPYKLVANLPYYSASPIIRRFLGADRKPERMVVMVQREVAQSMTAAPGKMSLMSVAVQLYGVSRIVCYAPPRAFRPAPKVTSAVVRIDLHPTPAIAFDREEDLFTLLRAGFSAPRKQIRNSLSKGLSVPSEVAEKMLSRSLIDPTRRSATLSLVEWGNLYAEFRSLLPAHTGRAPRAGHRRRSRSQDKRHADAEGVR